MVKDRRLYRLTFSKSLAEHICRTVPGMTWERRRFVLGERLPRGDTSPSGIYAVVKAATDWTLRITLFAELADHWRDPSRYVAACRLLPEEK